MIVFTVKGLTCGGCCAKVESAIAALALAAIKSCQVDLEKGQASVTVTDKVDTDALKNAIVSAGFGAELVESKEASS
jgi:copper chaperone CopZ